MIARLGLVAESEGVQEPLEGVLGSLLIQHELNLGGSCCERVGAPAMKSSTAAQTSS